MDVEVLLDEATDNGEELLSGSSLGEGLALDEDTAKGVLSFNAKDTVIQSSGLLGLFGLLVVLGGVILVLGGVGRGHDDN